MSQVNQGRVPMVIPRPIDYFEVYVSIFCIIWGGVSLARYSQVAATSVKMYPGWGGVAFLVLLVVGGATVLASFLFKTILGPRLEQAGLTSLVILCLAFGLWTPFSVGARGLGLLLSLVILIAAPGLHTLRRLRKYIRAVEAINDKRQ